MEKNIIARHITVYGGVQGVGFRYYTAHVARGLGIRGWVRNRADGSVEICARAEANAMEEFVRLVQKGPPAAYVERMKSEAVEIDSELFSYEGSSATSFLGISFGGGTKRDGFVIRP